MQNDDNDNNDFYTDKTMQIILTRTVSFLVTNKSSFKQYVTRFHDAKFYHDLLARKANNF